MAQEVEELLIIDISGRTPYGLKCKVDNTIPPCPSAEDYKNGNVVDIIDVTGIDADKEYEGVFDKDGDCALVKVRPYLRPMSSMTEDEKKEYDELLSQFGVVEYYKASAALTDWLNRNMFDYRGLIDLGIAEVAPDGMYK